MTKQPQPTHINAYETELDEKRREHKRLGSEIGRLEIQIDEMRRQQGLEPKYSVPADNDDGEDTDEPVPEEATGFGESTKKRGKK